MPETRSWDGAAYDRLSTPMEQLGREVMERLELRGDETIVDAGCGSGRLTQLLMERVPDGRVIGVDASASMIDAGRERLGDAADLRVGDLVGLDLGGATVDVVFSTATFHWIADHDALFASLRQALRPDGRLVGQCGGGRDRASVHRAAPPRAGAPPRAAGRETSRRCAPPPGGPATSRRSASTSRAGADPGTSRRPRTPSAASARPDSRRRSAGSPTGRCPPTTRGSTCARSTSARTSSASRPT